MAAGHALGDDDRFPWLDAVGGWLAAHEAGGVMSCSALKRKYRDQLRAQCPDVFFVHLDGADDVVTRRQAARSGHFMPTSLLASQLGALEGLGDDEWGVVIDIDQSVDAIVDEFMAATPTEEN